MDRSTHNLIFGSNVCGILFLAAFAVGLHVHAEDHPAAQSSAIAATADDIQPLQAGKPAPNPIVSNLAGESIPLHKLLDGKPTVVIFYRGSWCPYCTAHLKDLHTAEPKLIELGYQLLAISPDSPEHLKESVEKVEMKYQLLSDTKMEAAKTFGVAFQVDDKTLDRYKNYGIDLVAASGGEEHRALPVPSVFIIDGNGVNRWVHANPDYKKRLSNEELLNAAKEASDT